MLFLVFSLFFASFSFYLHLLFYHPSPPLTSLSLLGRGVRQIGHDALCLFLGDCIVGPAVMLVVPGLLAIMDPFCTQGRMWEIAIFLAEALPGFGRSDSTIFCFASAGLLSLLGGIGQVLVTNRFAEAGKVEGHRVEALVGLDIMGWVVAAVVGIRVADTLGSIRVSQLPSPYIASCSFAEYCFSSLFPLRCHSWRFVHSGVTACQAFQGRWGWGKEGKPSGPLALGMSSSFWLKMGKGNIWKSRACMKSVAWRGIF